MFTLPKYYAPDFSSEPLKSAPDVRWEEAAADGVARRTITAPLCFRNILRLTENGCCPKDPEWIPAWYLPRTEL